MPALSFEEILKFNHHHGADGRFASTDGAPAASAPARSAEEFDPFAALMGMAEEHQTSDEEYLAREAKRKQQMAGNHGSQTRVAPKSQLPEETLKACRNVESESVKRSTEQMTIIDGKGNIVAQKEGQSGEVSFTPGDINRMTNRTVTHNHPQEFGGTFSETDISAFAASGAKAFRAVGKEGTYHLERGDAEHKQVFNFQKEAKAECRNAQMEIAAGNKAIKSDVKAGLLTEKEGASRMTKLREDALTDLNHKYEQLADKHGLIYSFTPAGNTKKSWRDGEMSEFTVFKADEDKRLVFGWASIVLTVNGEELEDRQHDIIDPEDLEDAAYEYVLNFRDTGEEHLPGYRKKGKLVESVVLTKEKQKAMGIPDGILPVGWWIGFKIDDEDTWQRVKNGTYKMFSIEGKAQREPVKKARRNFEDFPGYWEWLEENLDASKEDQKAAEKYYGGKTHLKKADQPTGCGVLVIRDGKILTGTRNEMFSYGQICGPGGHIEEGETPEEAAKRETFEEFGITCNDLQPLGVQDGGDHGTSAVFLCTDYEGTPKTDEEEMTDLQWRTIGELKGSEMFLPFAQSLELLPERKTVAKSFEDVLKFNPYHDSLGRFSSGGSAASFTFQTRDPKKQHWADMAMARLKQQQAQQPAAPPKPTKNYDSRGFADSDDADYHQLYNRKQYYQQQQLTAAQQQSANAYVNPNTEPGSLYNVAQNLNWAMVNGQKLSPRYQKIHDDMVAASHNIGHNVTLTRYDHAGMVDSMLKQLGAGTDYTKMTPSQLKKALVGQTMGENKMISTSTNDLANAPRNVQQLFQNRAVKINYKTKAGVQGLLMPIGAGGDQGELVLMPTNGKTNKAPKITDVRFTGKSVYRAYNGRTYPQIEIDVEWD